MNFHSRTVSRSMLVFIFIVTAVFLVPAVSPNLLAAASGRKTLSPISVTTPKSVYTYNIELAVTNEQRMRGLMFRRKMPRDYGMLFDFDRTQKVAMWMKNTFLPLDMIFMRADGTIAHIVENTTPHSLAIISSRFPVRYVLELNAGEVARIAMRPGQVMKHSIFMKPGG